MTLYRPVIWTAAMRAACADIAAQPGNADIRSRAQEIANGARVGQTLTAMNCEFIAAMRSRFEPYGDALSVAAQRRFDDLWRDAWEAANPPPAPTFAALGWDGVDPVSIVVDGYRLTATTEADDSPDAPWLREDGHGPVRVAPRGNETADERVLSPGPRQCYYDWTEALKIAARDGWGPGTPEEAVQADFDRLQAWTNGHWGYVGVCVVVTRNGHTLTGKYSHALWGIESDAGAYFAQVADELSADALAEARQALADIVEGDRP